MERRVHRLSAGDWLNLAVETPDNPIHLGALAVLDGRSLRGPDGRSLLGPDGHPSIEDILRTVEPRLADVPQLRWTISRTGRFGGRPVWVDAPDLRLDRHVDLVELPEPRDEAALLGLAERLLAGPLDRSRPLWHMWLITGLPDGRIAVLVALHHAIADGLAAIRLVTSLLDAPETGTVGAPDPRPTRPAPEPTWRTRVSAVRRVLGVRHLLAATSGAPRTSLNGPVGPRRRLAALRLDLAEVKRVAHGHGGKVNDVVLGLAAAGLRELLLSRGEPVDGVWLRASVAVSLRTAEHAGEAGNRTGGIVVRLPLGEPDPGARLRAVAAQSAAAKRGQPPTTGQAVLVVAARLGLLQWFARRQRMVNIVQSNVAGPPTPIRAFGAPVLDLVPVGNLSGNIAVSFLAVSYAGRLTIAVRADADRFPDLPVLLAAMRREWTVLGGADSPAR